MIGRRSRATGFDVSRYASLALPFTFACDDPSLAARFADLYRACAETSFDRGLAVKPLELTVECEAGEYSLSVDGARVCERVGRDDVLEWCAWTVNRAAVERASASSFLLHAAAAAAPSGAVVLVGPSGAGKSTLAAALGLSGLAYMGDDGVALDLDTGAVRSNPKPVAVDDASRAALASFAPACRELRDAGGLLAPASIAAATPNNDAVPVALVVRPEHRSGSPATLAPMSPAAGAALLADESFNFEAHAPAALATMATLLRRVPAFDLAFDDLGSAIDAIDGALRDAAAARPSTPGSADTFSLPSSASLCVELLDGEAVVWDPARRELHHLNRLTTVAWSAHLEGGPDGVATAVARAARDGMLTGDDAKSAAERCLAELRAAGLLVAGASAQA